MTKTNLKRLCDRLGYTFKDIALLKRALTHRSVSVENNECLEFVGDSVLNFVIADVLFQTFPNCNEGELSRLRSFLVRGESLSEIAMEIQLGDYLNLGPGELKSGGFRRSSILADALEAVFAAIYMDGGFDITRQIIVSLFQSRLQDTTWQNTMKDFKTALQEYLQSIKKPLPVYELSKVEGGEHDQIFHVTCSVQGTKIVTSGEATTRRKAEQIAAGAFLKILQH